MLSNDKCCGILSITKYGAYTISRGTVHVLPSRLHLRLAKTQTSLRIHAVGSESLHTSLWVTKDPKCLPVDSAKTLISWAANAILWKVLCPGSLIWFLSGDEGDNWCNYSICVTRNWLSKKIFQTMLVAVKCKHMMLYIIHASKLVTLLVKWVNYYKRHVRIVVQCLPRMRS